MKHYHGDLFPGRQRDPGKLIWIRLVACFIIGFTLAVIVVSCSVMLINKIMEQ